MKNLCKFRCRSHHLPVNNGQFIEVTKADLKCTLCKSGDDGDEYHYLCVCVCVCVNFDWLHVMRHAYYYI